MATGVRRLTCGCWESKPNEWCGTRVYPTRAQARRGSVAGGMDAVHEHDEERCLRRQGKRPPRPQVRAFEVIVDARCRRCGMYVAPNTEAHGPLGGPLCRGQGAGERRYQLMAIDGGGFLRPPTDNERARFASLIEDALAAARREGQRQRVDVPDDEGRTP